VCTWQTVGLQISFGDSWLLIQQACLDLAGSVV
jgi:hypothetical protein